MKPTLVVIGTCYSGITLLPAQECLIAKEPVSQDLYIYSLDRCVKIHLHQLMDFYSVVLQTANHEVKTHD